MAIKITTDSIVRVVRPSGNKFYLDELNEHVDGFIEPLKIGPVWVMYPEKAKDNGEALNQVASFFFGLPMYGTVLVVPPHQLPADWDLMDPDDYRYTADDLESGFLLSLQTALIHNRVFGTQGGGDNVERLNDRFIPKEEWTYRPPAKDEVDESTRDFYHQVYTYISNNPDSFSKNILLSDEHMVIRIENTEDKKRMIQQMIDFFVAQEEYEKCALLQNALK